MDLIKVTIIDNRGYVFNAKDYIRLRSEYRIVGSLVGCVVGCPRNSNVNGLPAVLSPVELQLLTEQHLIRTTDQATLQNDPDPQEAQAYAHFRKQSFEDQQEHQRLAKLAESRKVIDKIIAGKRKKLMKSGVPEDEIQLDAETVLGEIYAGCAFNADNALVQVPTQHVGLGAVDDAPTSPTCSINAPTTSTHTNTPPSGSTLKYRVFRDLWHRGKYVTIGDTFGGDFLVYPGDPMYFHASHIVHCIDAPSTEVAAARLVACGRLAVLVNKLCVFVYADETSEELVYQTMQWEGNEIGVESRKQTKASATR